MNRRLLVVGSNSIHVYNFIDLVQAYFDEILLISNEKHEESTIDTKVLDFHLGLQSIKTIKEIKNIAEVFSPTHLHIHQVNTYAFLTLLALKNKSYKKVLNAWGSDILLSPQKSIFLREIVKFSLKNADIVIADSNIVLNEAKKLVPTIQVRNINFGIGFLPCQEDKENIIYSNRLHKSLYNIDKILISFSKFIRQNPSWKLVIAGNGEDTKKLKTLAEKLRIKSKVDFIGFVNQKTNFEYYCKAKIYVSIPKSDSISLSLVEAIVNHCIVFVSKLDANKEVVNSAIGFFEDDLENINFMQYLDVNAMSQRETINNLKRLFSKEYNRQRYIEIYEN